MGCQAGCKSLRLGYKKEIYRFHSLAFLFGDYVGILLFFYYYISSYIKKFNFFLDKGGIFIIVYVSRKEVVKGLRLLFGSGKHLATLRVT